MISMLRIAALSLGLMLLSGCQSYEGGGVFSLQSSDASLNTAVQTALQNNHRLAEFPLHVETAAGIVYLSGYVKTIKQSDTAAEVAAKVRGVKQVENNIIVRR